MQCRTTARLDICNIAEGAACVQLKRESHSRPPFKLLCLHGLFLSLNSDRCSDHDSMLAFSINPIGASAVAPGALSWGHLLVFLVDRRELALEIANSKEKAFMEDARSSSLSSQRFRTLSRGKAAAYTATQVQFAIAAVLRPSGVPIRPLENSAKLERKTDRGARPRQSLRGVNAASGHGTAHSPSKPKCRTRALFAR